MKLTERDKQAMAAFGKRIRIIRVELHLTQAQLAGLLWEGSGGMNSISRLEQGVARGISAGMLMRLASLCESKGFSLHWLLLGPGAKGLKAALGPHSPVTEKLLALHAALHEAGEGRQ